jgi:hypothetical protein
MARHPENRLSVQTQVNHLRYLSGAKLVTAGIVHQRLSLARNINPKDLPPVSLSNFPLRISSANPSFRAFIPKQMNKYKRERVTGIGSHKRLQGML